MTFLHRGPDDSYSYADVGPMLLCSDDLAFTFPQQGLSDRLKLYREADGVLGSIRAACPEERAR